MNQVYKVVWNASLGAWVAVSELAKNKTKTRTVKSIATTILLGVAIPAYADVIAGNNITVTTINGDTKIETTDNPNFSTVTATGTIKGQTLESTGAATVGNGLTVTAGTTSLKDTTVNGVLNTTGAVNANSLNVTGNTTASNITASGIIKGQTLESTGAATVGNGLTVTAGTTSLKDTTVNGVLNTTGVVNANSLNVTGNTTASNITASGIIKGQTLESTGAATVGNGLTVTAGTTSLKNTTINGTLSTSGIASLNGGASLNNKIINNLAAGTVDTDAANYAQVKAAKTQIAASGKNTSITSTTGSDGQTIYTVNTIDNPNFTSVTTTGAVTVGNGLTVNSGATSLKNTSVDGTLTTSGVASLNGGADLNNKQIKNLASATTDGDAVNLGQIKSLLGVNDPSVTYNGIKYFRTKSINADAQANGDESVAIGPQAKSDGLSAISIGDQALASADSSISIGKTAKASAAGSISLGEKSLAYGQNNVAIGKESSALGLNSTAIGATTGTPRTPQLTRDTNNNNRIIAVDGIPVTTDPNSTGQNISNIIAINNTSVTPAQLNSFMSLLSSGANLSAGKNSLTVGTSNLATGDSSASIGAINAATGNSSTAVGSGNKAIGSSSIAIGDNSIANGGGSTAIGKQASSNRQNAVAIGSGATADTDYGISIGQNAGQGSSQGTTNDRVEHIAIGKNAGQNVVGNQNIAIGSGAGSNLSPDSNSSSDSNIAIGIAAGSGMNGDDNISVGRNSNINGGAISRAITLGSETKGSSQSVVVGTASKVNSGTDATIVGYNAQVNGSGGVAIGSNTVAAANNVALGTNSNASLNSTKNAYLVPDTIANVASVGYSVVSVGNGTTTRRITNLAPGGSPTDAVNVSQLTQLHQDVSTILGLSGSTDNKFGDVNVNGTKYSSLIAAIAAGGNGGALPTGYYVTYTNADQNNIVLSSNGGQGTTINNVATATTNDQAVNLGQVKALTKDATVKYVSINSTDGANNSSDQAVANNSLAIGPSTGTSSIAENSIALGSNVRTEAINSIAIGNAGTRAKGSNSIAIGKENTTIDINNIALGTLVSTKGADSIGIGKNVQIDATNNTTNYAVAIGSEAEVQNADQAIVVGRKAIVSGDNGIAFGNQALTQGEQGIAIGRSSLSSAQNSTAIGNNTQSTAINANALGNTAKASGQSANAIGDGAIASGQYSTALGTASASADNTIAIGKQAETSALNAIAIGTGAKSEGQQAIALGQLARAYDESSIATGTGANAYKKNTIATGTNSNAYAEASIALGANATVNNTHNNAVALGSNSISGDYNQTTKSTINGKEYSYAGAGTNLSTVSIGAINKERQIINVAAGRVSSTSTDAINGSQLFQTNEEISNLANKTAQALGGGAVSNQATGGISAPSYTVTTNPAGNGSKVTVNNVGAALSALDGAVNQAIGFAGDTGNNASRKLGETLNLKGGASGTLTTSNIGVVANGSNQLDIRLAESINLGTNGSVTTGSTSIKNNEVKVGSNSLTNSGLNIGNVNINSTANTVVGLNNTTWNPAGTYNSGRAATEEQLLSAQNQLNTTLTNKGLNFRANTGASDNVKLGETITLADGTNTTAEYDAATNTYRYNVIANPTFTTVTTGNSKLDTNGLTITNPADSTKTVSVTGAGINAGNNKISNLADGLVAANSKEAVNGGQLNTTNQNVSANTTNISNLQNQTFKLQANNDTASSVKSTDTVKFTDGKNVAITRTGNEITVATKDTVNFDKVTVGNITLDKTTNKISGVAAGAVTSTSTEAINGSQLYGAANNVKNIIGGATTIDTATGTL
ncbi:ESPR-type extended signal peptide-containing protein, partial [Acinetobacter soli]|uniref:ESPR-type extended signal peptide-containing protein n=3 Tax=Acinetobacter soli TaxID=487316 RepID=UPI0025B1A561